MDCLLKTLSVAHITNNYLPLLNGVSVSIDSFYNQRKGAIYNSFVISPQHRLYSSHSEDVQLKSVDFKYKTSYPIAICTINQISKLLRDSEVDIVHSHHPFGLGKTAQIATRKKIKKPLVFTYHTLYEYYLHYFPLLDCRKMRQWVKQSAINYCHNCDHVIAPSEHVYELLSTHISADKISIVRTVPRQARDRYTVDVDGEYILIVSRLSKEKQLDLALKTFVEVTKSVEHTKLIIVGEGPERKTLLGIAKKLNISDSVFFLGTQDYDVLSALYKNAKCLLFTSTTETQALVLWEAYVHGLPYVAVESSVALELHRKIGCGFVASSCPRNISKCVIEILSSSIDKKLPCGDFKEMEKLEKIYCSLA